MAKKNSLNPFALAVGASLAGSLAGMGTVMADTNPFGLTSLSNGYQVAADATTTAPADAGKKAEGKCGEGKCGADKKKAEGKCGEGKCGADKKKAEGKCGEGKCGADKAKEGKCGGQK